MRAEDLDQLIHCLSHLISVDILVVLVVEHDDAQEDRGSQTGEVVDLKVTDLLEDLLVTDIRAAPAAQFQEFIPDEIKVISDLAGGMDHLQIEFLHLFAGIRIHVPALQVGDIAVLAERLASFIDIDKGLHQFH